MNNRLTAKERAHLLRVKKLQCSVCDHYGPYDEKAGAPLVEAHHIDQGLNHLVIPLCADCHRGSHNGIHGQRRIWNVLKKTELTCLNQTVERLLDGMV